VSAAPSNHPQSVPRGPNVILGKTLSGPSPPAGRIWLVKPPAAKEKGSPMFLVLGQKAPVGRAQLHNTFFYFHFELIQFKFKSSLNFGNS
jgi:hypothetical protein